MNDNGSAPATGAETILDVPPAELMCPSGHSNAPGGRYCSQCGGLLSPVISTNPLAAAPVEPAIAAAAVVEPRAAVKHRWRWAVGAVTVATVVAAIAVVASRQHSDNGSAKVYRSVNVYLTLDSHLGAANGSWDDCWGTTEFGGDFGPGQTLTVSDGAGNVIGVGTTESIGSLSEMELSFMAQDENRTPEQIVRGLSFAFPRYCEVRASIDTHQDAETFEISSGGGSLIFTAAELDAVSSIVDMTINAG